MKMMKLIYPLGFALAVTLAGTGCKHTPGKITELPDSNHPMIGNNNDINTLPEKPLNTDDGVNSKNEGVIPTTSPDEFENMIMDRAALAANTIHFAFDSAAIRPSEQSNLEAVATALKGDQSTKLLIEGNCDERGTDEYNRSLGERRALAAREALAKDGIDPARIRTISYGKDKPVDPGHDAAAWEKNRRDDFVLLHPKTGV
jgi:peptidoglycan-associated lipoprotein